MAASVSLAKHIVETFKSPDERASLLARAGLDPGVLDDCDARMPHHVHVSLWQHAQEASGSQSFGVQVASRLSASSYGVLGYAMASSASLREALRRLRSYSSLLYDEIVLTEREQGDEVALTYALAGNVAPPALFEAALTSLVLNAQRLTGGRFRPLALQFCHRNQGSDIARYLRTEVRFGQAQNAVIAHRSALDLPIATHDPVLLSVLERHANDLLQRLPRADDFVSQVRRQLLTALPSGVPSAARIAKQLALSERTLQRRLQEQGFSLRALVDAMRRDLALEQLARSDTSIAQIAFMLGFSDDRAFHKACARWTGGSPSAYRSAMRG